MECKLDRAFCSASCHDFLNAITCTALYRHQSDHNLLLLSFSHSLTSGSQVMSKLKLVKVSLKVWNTLVFGSFCFIFP